MILGPYGHLTIQKVVKDYAYSVLHANDTHIQRILLCSSLHTYPFLQNTLKRGIKSLINSIKFYLFTLALKIIIIPGKFKLRKIMYKSHLFYNTFSKMNFQIVFRVKL